MNVKLATGRGGKDTLDGLSFSFWEVLNFVFSPLRQLWSSLATLKNNYPLPSFNLYINKLTVGKLSPKKKLQKNYLISHILNISQRLLCAPKSSCCVLKRVWNLCETLHSKSRVLCKVVVQTLNISVVNVHVVQCFEMFLFPLTGRVSCVLHAICLENLLCEYVSKPTWSQFITFLIMQKISRQ